MMGYRKFIAAGVVFATATTLVVLHLISGGEWVTVSSLTLGVFTAGNVVAKFQPDKGDVR